MPSQTSLLRSSLGFLVAGALLVAGVIVASLWLADRSERTLDGIVVERNIRRAAIDLLSAMQDAETGQRGYLVAQEQAFLDPYLEGAARAPGLLRELGARLAARGGATAVIPALEDAVADKLDFVEEVLAIADGTGFAAARARVAAGDGRAAMNRIRDIIGGIESEAELRLLSAITQQRAVMGQLVLSVVVIALVIAALVAGAILIVARRVRELGQAQGELSALNATLEERVTQRTQDLMRASQEVQRFAYIVTHDLRAPLVNIMGFTSELEAATRPLQAYVLAEGGAVSEQDILDARAAAAEDLPEALGFIRASARKMDGLINAILKLSRDGRRQIRPERIDLRALAERATDAVRHQIDASEGSVAIEVRAPSIISDRLSVDQILGNLVDNAVKYAEPGRPLALSIRTQPMGGEFVAIEVEDNGRGIAQTDQERVLELFRRAGKHDRDGEGIGLAHVRTLARNIGGEITVRSVPGKGSTFLLRLPADLRTFGAVQG
ncbi:CHASE3 domain-containing protein [soil metagenome]